MSQFAIVRNGWNVAEHATTIPVANAVPMNAAGGMLYLAADAKFPNYALVAGFVFALDVVEQLPA